MNDNDSVKIRLCVTTNPHSNNVTATLDASDDFSPWQHVCAATAPTRVEAISAVLDKMERALKVARDNIGMLGM